jgi:xanthine dehydrogenase molybdopterin-binding subunit B
METQTVLCIPQEGDAVKIVGATQYTSFIQLILASVTGLIN